MKHQINKIAFLSFSLLVLIAATGCKKSFFSSANHNPNSPKKEDVGPDVLLPTIEASLAYSIGGEYSRYTSILTQQVAGSYLQASAFNVYIFSTNDFDALWGNIYTSVLENNFQLQELSDAKGYAAYGGISRVLTAYTLQLVVDAWGSAPYSAALKGDLNLHPAFDDGKALYDTVLNLLDRAIVLLQNPSKGALAPKKDDFIYQGDTDKWVKLAHALKARAYIHQSKGNTTMANNALTEIAASFTSIADNARLSFSLDETAANPWFQFNQQRGYIDFAGGQFLDSMMLENVDPRYNVYMDSTFEDINGIGMGPYYGNANSPVEFITLDELLFIKAEATLRSGGSLATAQTYFRQAIDSNMLKLGVDPGDRATYIAARGTLSGTTANAIARVAEEAYVALYLNPEVWALWRRTGSPVLKSRTSGSIPRRFLYPQSEISNNGANTPSSTLQAPKIFWDN